MPAFSFVRALQLRTHLKRHAGGLQLPTFSLVDDVILWIAYPKYRIVNFLK